MATLYNLKVNDNSRRFARAGAVAGNGDDAMRHYGVSYTGLIRENNEDAFYAEDGLYVVADGMGGHQGGEVASRMAVDLFCQGLKDKKILAQGNDLTLKQLKKELEELLKKINLKIIERAATDPLLYGMGTTITCAMVIGHNYYILNIGDSRAYLFRNNSLRRITEDHSVVGELIREGKLTEEQARYHPFRNILTNVLGYSEDVYFDLFEENVQSGDLLLLCTDGLNSVLTDEEIEALLKQDAKDLEKTADALLRRTKLRGAPDNVTVILVSA